MNSPGSMGVTEVAAHLSYYDSVPTPATASIVSYRQPQRLARAVGGGLTCWGLALISIFIPLGHFFLVPAFAVGGPVVFLLRLGEGTTLRESRGSCPVCGREQVFTESGRLQTHHPVRCASYGRRLELTLNTVTETEADRPHVRVTVERD